MKKKKLFECVGGNTFRLIKESEWAETQENNERVNRQRRMLKHEMAYMKSVLASPLADPEVVETATAAMKDAVEFDQIVAKGYLDSGYQYDDKDPRNQMDVHGDRYWDDNIERARKGSTKSDEVEAEIRQQVSQRHLDERMRGYEDFFTNDLAERIFPQGDEMYGIGLREYMSEVGSQEAQNDWDYDHDDDHRD
jgi:hypothetical protein